jgi:hypothetical protein
LIICSNQLIPKRLERKVVDSNGLRQRKEIRDQRKEIFPELNNLIVGQRAQLICKLAQENIRREIKALAVSKGIGVVDTGLELSHKRAGVGPEIVRPQNEGE